LWSTCADPCASSRQHERELYAAKPRPTPVGRSPALLIDVPEKLMPQELAVDAAGRVWIAGTSRTADSLQRFSVALLEPSLALRWRWDDPTARVMRGTPSIVRLGEQVVVSASLGELGEGALLFFDSNGFVREVATSLMLDQGLAALGRDLLVKEQPTGSAAPSLVIIDAQGAQRFRAPQATFDGFNLFWTHAARAPAGWTLISQLDSRGLQWRRVAELSEWRGRRSRRRCARVGDAERAARKRRRRLPLACTARARRSRPLAMVQRSARHTRRSARSTADTVRGDVCAR
jgi:hypothetical protein